jgi:hypothetical protein
VNAGSLTWCSTLTEWGELTRLGFTYFPHFKSPFQAIVQFEHMKSMLFSQISTFGDDRHRF